MTIRRTVTNDSGMNIVLPFKEHMKHSVDFQSSNPTFAGKMNADGYFNGTLDANVIEVVAVDQTYTGHYRFRWTGTISAGGLVLGLRTGGAFTVHAGGGFVDSGNGSSNLALSGTNGDIEFSFSVTQTQGILLTYSGTHAVTRMSFCRCSGSYANDAADIDSGDLSLMFSPAWIANQRQLNHGTFRALNWMGLNQNYGSNLSRYAYWAQASNRSFLAPAYLASLWKGAASGTNSYTLTGGVGSPVNGTTFQFYVVNASNSTTSLHGKPCVDGGGTPIAMPAGLTTAVYDELIVSGGCWMCWNATSSYGQLARGTPIAVLVAMCNLIGCNLWIPFPHLMDAASVASAVAEVGSLLDPSLELFVGYSNELWNFQYAQATWATNRGIAASIPSGDSRRILYTYGKAAVEMWAAADTAWLPRTTGLRKPLEWQMYGDISGAYTTYLLGGADIPGHSSGATRPGILCTDLSPAPYASGAMTPKVVFGSGPDYNATEVQAAVGPVGNTVGLLGAADQYATGTAANKKKALLWMDWNMRSATSSVGYLTHDAQVNTYFPPWASAANTWGKKVTCYEDANESFGPSVDWCTANSIDTKYGNTLSSGAVATPGTIQNLINAYKHSAYYYKLCRERITLDGGAVTAGYTSAQLFNDNGLDNPWGSMERGLDSATFQSFSAHADYNNGKVTLFSERA